MRVSNWLGPSLPILVLLAALGGCRLFVTTSDLTGGGTSADGGVDGARPQGAALASLTVTPDPVSLASGRTQQFAVVGKDAKGNVVDAPGLTWTSGVGTVSPTGLFTAGATSGSGFVTAQSGAILGSAAVTVTGSATITIGETNVRDNDDSGNAGYLLAQEVTLGTAATIKSISFYITQAVGKVRYGIYDATGADGNPGAKKAETAEVVAAMGFNAVDVTTPVLLQPGKYWLAYAPESSDMHFRLAGDGTGKLVYYQPGYGPLPATFGPDLQSLNDHWSFYATLTQ